MLAEIKKRTLQQNRALHKWFDLLADDLNDAGLTMMKTLKPQAEIPWSAITIKELLFKQIIKAMFNKEKTSELTAKELTQASEVLTKHLAEKFSLETSFPSLESLLYEEK